jgi:hypothetical protein
MRAQSMPNGDGPAWGRSRRQVASYSSYADAEKAVDYLSDNKFPVERVAIVARDLEMVEQIVGRMTWGKAALGGAATGGIVGLLIGWLFATFNWVDPAIARVWLVIDGLWFGMIVGILIGLFTHALQRGRRDFESIPQMTAERFDILVEEDYADDARRMLDGLHLPSRIDQPGPSAVSREPEPDSGVDRLIASS